MVYPITPIITNPTEMACVILINSTTHLDELSGWISGTFLVGLGAAVQELDAVLVKLLGHIQDHIDCFTHPSLCLALCKMRDRFDGCHVPCVITRKTRVSH